MNNEIIKKTIYEDCGVNEEVFPFTDKCYRKNDAVFMASYEKMCPYCDISACLPYGASLKIVTIFECNRLGYGKRVSE